MGVTEADIKNWALVRCGQRRILDVETSNSRNAEVVNAEYPLALEHCLRLADWSFATSRIKLSADTVAPTFGYTYAYTPPVDLCNIQGVYSPDVVTIDPTTPKVKYQYEKGKILCEANGINLIYTSKEVASTLFTPEFIALLRLAIAKEIAYSITLSEGIAQAINTQFEEAKVEYLSLDNKGDDYNPVEGNQPYEHGIDFGGIFD